MGSFFGIVSLQRQDDRTEIDRIDREKVLPGILSYAKRRLEGEKIQMRTWKVRRPLSAAYQRAVPEISRDDAL